MWRTCSAILWNWTVNVVVRVWYAKLEALASLPSRLQHEFNQANVSTPNTSALRVHLVLMYKCRCVQIWSFPPEWKNANFYHFLWLSSTAAYLTYISRLLLRHHFTHKLQHFLCTRISVSLYTFKLLPSFLTFVESAVQQTAACPFLCLPQLSQCHHFHVPQTHTSTKGNRKTGAFSPDRFLGEREQDFLQKKDKIRFAGWKRSAVLQISSGRWINPSFSVRS